MHRLRFLAFITLAGGSLLLARVGDAVAAEFADGFRMPVLTVAILGTACAVVFAIFWTAIAFLKRPSRRSAMRLAVAGSATLCFIWPKFHGFAGGGFLVGLFFYIFVFRSVISAAFQKGGKEA